jgi:probable rRNA maturation factor
VAPGRMRDATVDLTDVPAPLREAVGAALEAAGVGDGHVAVEIVGEERIRELNATHRNIDKPTDVLAFPLDGTGPSAGPRELGDVVICPEHCSDEVEAAVHGTLHLCGYDHETDDGEMLALQAKVLRALSDPLPSDRGSERASISDASRTSGSRGGERN